MGDIRICDICDTSSEPFYVFICIMEKKTIFAQNFTYSFFLNFIDQLITLAYFILDLYLV